MKPRTINLHNVCSFDASRETWTGTATLSIAGENLTVNVHFRDLWELKCLLEEIERRIVTPVESEASQLRELLPKRGEA